MLLHLYHALGCSDTYACCSAAGIVEVALAKQDASAENCTYLTEGLFKGTRTTINKVHHLIVCPDQRVN